MGVAFQMKRYLIETAGKPRIVEADKFVLVGEKGSRYAHFVFCKGEEQVAVFDAKYLKAVIEL